MDKKIIEWINTNKVNVKDSVIALIIVNLLIFIFGDITAIKSVLRMIVFDVCWFVPFVYISKYTRKELDI